MKPASKAPIGSEPQPDLFSETSLAEEISFPMTDDERRLYALEIALDIRRSLNQATDASHIVAQAKIIEEYLKGEA